MRLRDNCGLRSPPQPHFHDAIWDYAAGSLLIEEAGGRVSDLGGRPLDFTAGRRLFATRGSSPRTTCSMRSRSGRSDT
jgi:3'-phosphoadenosine 5'-phosphosulfate (PAPS) 3'-phosphatase